MITPAEHVARLPYGTQQPVGLYVSTVLADMDFETYSEAGYVWDDAAGKWTGPPGAPKGKKGLGVVGVSVYTEHPTFEVLSLKYDLKDGLGVRTWTPGAPLPYDLFDHVAAGRLIEAHNAGFEMAVWARCVDLYGWPAVPHLNFRCSMAKARAAALPGALDKAAEVVGTMRKDPAGDKLLKRFAMPQNPTAKNPARRVRPQDDPEGFAGLLSYNERDIVAEAHLSYHVPDLTPIELEHWQFDQAINRRGVHVDEAALRGAAQIVNAVNQSYGREALELTGGIGPTQIAKTRAWLADRGCHMASLDEDAVADALKRTDLLPEVRRVLELRSLVGSSSVKKVFAMLNQRNKDGRLTHLFNFHATRTGRPTGDGPQPTNMPKAGPKVHQCQCGRWYGVGVSRCPWCLRDAYCRVNRDGELNYQEPQDWNPAAMMDALEIVRIGRKEVVEFFFGDALLTVAGTLRGMFDAAPRMRLMSSDYTAIEAVGLACVAGEQWRIDLFRNRGKIYEKSGALIGGVPYESLLEYARVNGQHHPLRQIGKTCFTRDTLVLTDRGWSNITDVKTTDKLWDGVEWVTHEGVLNQGKRQVINLAGIGMTPDHRINCGGSWREAHEVISSPSLIDLALATGSAHLPWWVTISDQWEDFGTSGYSVTAGRLPTGCSRPTCDQRKVRGATYAPVKPLGTTEKSTSVTRTQCLTTSTVAGCSTVSRLRLRDATPRTENSTAATAVAESEFATNGGKIGALSCDTCKPCLDTTTLHSTWTGSTATETTSREISASLPAEKTTSTGGKCTSCRPESQNLRNVFDIANAGPRRRFTVLSDRGPLLVHNCELGLGYGGWINAWRNFDDNPDTTDEFIKDTILKWRKASPAIPEFWGGQTRRTGYDRYETDLYGVEGTFIKARIYPDRWHEYRGFWFICRGDTVYIRLLSGRLLTYRNVTLRQSTRRGNLYDITYWGWNTNPKNGPQNKWVEIYTHGGKLTENIVQAVCNDILRFAIANLERAGYPVVLHVYDEIVSEVPEDGSHTLEEFERIMATLPDWAVLPDGSPWPIRVDGGWVGKNYRKG